MFKLKNEKTHFNSLILVILFLFSYSSVWASNFEGNVYEGKAVSGKSGKSWPMTITIKSYNQSSGKVSGEIEWPSLKSVHYFEGKRMGQIFRFKELSYIIEGGARLNCQYECIVHENEMYGEWFDGNSDKGTLRLAKQDVQPKKSFDHLSGSIYSGKAISGKSGNSWPVHLKIISYDQATGRVIGEMEWPTLKSVHTIEGNLLYYQLKFREVDYVQKGGANLNCEYVMILEGDQMEGSWTDHDSDNGSISLTKKIIQTPKTSFPIVGSVFSGKAVSGKSGSSWPFSIKITFYNQANGDLNGEISWPTLNSVHRIAGKLKNQQIRFKENGYITQGKANLNCEYKGTISGNEMNGTWTDPSSDKGTFNLKKK